MYDCSNDPTTMPQTARSAFERLQGDYGQGDKLPKRAKPNLVLGDIHTEPEVFQHREEDPEDRWYVELHIGTLVGAIMREKTQRLDPITVWCCGRRMIVLDGHYRLEAYIRYAEGQGIPLRKFAVPCEVFQGDPLAAWDYSATANRKVTAPLTTTERSNAAWKRVCLSWKDGEWITSKADLTALGLVGSNTISRMRRALIELTEKGMLEGRDPMELTWTEAERLYKGDPLHDHEFDASEDSPLVRDWADRLTRTFGKEAWRAPQLFYFAMELYSPKMVESLKDYLTDDEELPF